LTGVSKYIYHNGNNFIESESNNGTQTIINSKIFDQLKTSVFVIYDYPSRGHFIEERCDIIHLELYCKLIQRFAISTRYLHEKGYTMKINDLWDCLYVFEESGENN